MPVALILLLFIAVPVAELWLLFAVADWLGPGGGLATLALVILTGMAGASLAKIQGLKVITAIQTDLARGQMPTDHLISGLLVLAGALLLVTPGMLTDAAGLLLMIPGNRRLLISPVRRFLARRFPIRPLFPLGPHGPTIREADGVQVHDEP